MLKLFQKTKNKISKKMLVTGIISTGLALSTLFSYAANYNLATYRQPFYYGHVVNFRWGNISGAYQNAFSLGLNKWNSVQSDLNWGNVSSTPAGCADNYIDVFASNVTGLYGLTTTYSNSSNKVTSCEMSMNTTTNNGHSANWFQSVATHEIGHGMSLNDYNNGTVIMNQNRNRDTVYTPQSDDILGVTTAY